MDLCTTWSNVRLETWHSVCSNHDHLSVVSIMYHKVMKVDCKLEVLVGDGESFSQARYPLQSSNLKVHYCGKLTRVFEQTIISTQHTLFVT